MKKLVLLSLFLLFPSLAFGQCNGAFPAGSVCGNSSTSPATPGPISSFVAGAHLQFNSTGPAPTVTAGCNGAGSVVSGNDVHGTIIGSTAAATTCTLTFGTAYASAPDCSIDGLSSPLTGAITVSTAAIVVNFTSTANFKWSYICFGT